MVPNKQISIFLMICLLCIANSPADTFKNRQTGEVFHGFATQKGKLNMRMVYNEDNKTFKSLDLNEYDITINDQGRRNNVAVVDVKQEVILLSKAVSDIVGQAIIDASNKGPRYIFVEIDSPGGRGDYMKQLCAAITQTSNCPVIAYIAGGKFGGAYSASVAIALACDKIYMAPDTAMGTVAPVVGDMDDEYIANYTETFNSTNLSAYKGYFGALAEKNNRPNVVAMAIVDRNIEVIEVADKDGIKSLIDKADRQSSQSIVRSLSKQVIIPSRAEDSVGSGNQGNTALTLTPTDAFNTKMADKIVASRTELLADLGASDAKLIKMSSSIDKTIRKFTAAKRNLKQLMASIDYLQTRKDQLMELMDENNKNATVTRESYLDNRQAISGRDSTLQERMLRQRTGTEPASARSRGSRVRDNLSSSEVLIESQSMATRAELMDELSLVLIGFTRDCNKALVLGRRFPGALPMSVTLGELQNQLNAAQVLFNNLTYRR